MEGDALPRVLVVDDDPQVRDLFVDFLDGRYEVEAVQSGEAALETVSDDVDVVLLDRLMPGLSGREVLAKLQARDLDCRVAMVTAVEPELDVIDVGFDDYLIKPVSRSGLLNTVDSLLHWADYDAVVERYFRTGRRVAVLEATYTEARLADDDRYEELLQELAALREEAHELVDDLDVEGVHGVDGDLAAVAGTDSSPE